MTSSTASCASPSASRAEQRGSGSATRLEFALVEHPQLAEVIRRARESSMAHDRCPYIVHHRPKRNLRSEEKTHPCQVLKAMLAKQFRDCRGDLNTSFHEIRGLSSVLFRRSGYDLGQIQALMAHTDEAVTRGYQDGHDLPHSRISMVIGEVGGEF